MEKVLQIHMKCCDKENKHSMWNLYFTRPDAYKYKEWTADVSVTQKRWTGNVCLS